MAAREPNELEQALADITTNKSITNYLIINSEGIFFWILCFFRCSNQMGRMGY